ncbi:MAG TPA: hypothetical protein VLI39_19070 [Sedimentisphaerales bacterium]|nr:hypothetical protein [Sedimentisphaerales bacterium]
MNWSFLHRPEWFVTSDDRHSGAHSARAGRIGHDEITSLSLTVDCVAGPIRFWRKVSAEVAWSEVSFPVEAGKRTFRREYEKDDAGSCGQDTVYLDELTIPAAW